MKSCPSCGDLFSDDLRFCLHDGTALTGAILDPNATAVLPPDISNDVTIASTSDAGSGEIKKNSIRQLNFSAVEPKSRMGCVMSIGQITAVVLVVAVGGFIVVRVLLPAQSSPPGVNLNDPSGGGSNSTYANAAMNRPKSSPTPTPSQTPKTSPKAKHSQ